MDQHQTFPRTAYIPMAAILFIVAVVLLLTLSPARAQAATLYTIQDDGPGGTGGQCSSIGTWDGNTHTCTLTQDVTAAGDMAIEIVSNGIVLEGAGHTVSGNDTAVGIYLTNVSGVVVQNVTVTDFFAAVEIFGGSSNTVTNSTLAGSSEGIFVFNGSNLNNITASTYLNNSTAVYLQGANFNLVARNNISGSSYGVVSTGSVLNSIKNNNITGANGIGIDLNGSSNWNTVTGNMIDSGNVGLNIADSSYVQAYNNTFNNNSSHLFISGSSANLTFNLAQPVGGNYWDTHATPAQGCQNSDNDRFCDSPLGLAGGNNDALPLARRSYYFTWYDQVSPGSQNWILMTNPIDATTYPDEDAWFDLSIAGSGKALTSSYAGGSAGQVIPLGGITPAFPNLKDGPVEVGYHARMRQMVSQRTLWGDSLEEITGTDAARLSDRYFWTWYDQQSAGFTNWIMVANPDPVNAVRVEIRIGGDLMNDPGAPGNSFFDIPAGGRIMPAFPGIKDGPVEIRAYDPAGTWPASARNVIASQRVLANYGAAFNEEPGIPLSEASDHYIWPWYDNVGGQNWIMLANQTTTDPVYYRVSIAGGCASADPAYKTANCREGSIQSGLTTPVMLPGVANGPVEVWSWSDSVGGSSPISIIASQRVIWGPSFEETPGHPYGRLARTYNWTWYDQQSAGSLNWVMVANPNPSTAVTFQIKVGDAAMTLQDATPPYDSDFLYPGEIKSYAFPATMNGPVRVIGDNNLIASQRVLWKGYFNEVTGTVLD